MSVDAEGMLLSFEIATSFFGKFPGRKCREAASETSTDGSAASATTALGKSTWSRLPVAVRAKLCLELNGDYESP
jgi:hypothetical protein